MSHELDVQRANGEGTPSAVSSRSGVEWRQRAFGWNDGLAVATVALICGLAVYVGMPVLREFENEIFSNLSNGYRVLEGQVPHRDFASALGPVFFLIPATGLAISGMRPEGLAYANALFGAVIALWTYGTARGRMAGAGAFVLAVYAALLITAPYSLGYNPVAFTYGMFYNRYGYALLGIVVLECGLEALRKPGSEPPGAGRGFFAGVAWALLVFLKISYGIVAVPFLFLWICCGAGRRRMLLGLCGGFAVASAMMLGYLRFDVADMLRDLACAASGRSATWRLASILNPVAAIESVPLILLAAVASAGSGETGGWRRVRLWSFTLLTVGIGALVLSTNHQAMSLPLDGIAAVILMNAVVRREAGGRGGRIRWMLAMYLASMCVLPLAAMGGVSLAAASWERYGGLEPPTERLQAARAARIVFGPVMAKLTTETGGTAYVESLNDGLNLIRAHAGATDGVMTIDEFNPFNYLLDRQTPRGGMAACSYNYMFSDAKHPSADRFFGDAKWVIERKYSRAAEDFPIENYWVQGILRVYGPALEDRFRPVEETAHWVLWRRK
jgi:hypothetical protein